MSKLDNTSQFIVLMLYSAAKKEIEEIISFKNIDVKIRI